jgi:hypothetical protein
VQKSYASIAKRVFNSVETQTMFTWIENTEKPTRLTVKPKEKILTLWGSDRGKAFLSADRFFGDLLGDLRISDGDSSIRDGESSGERFHTDSSSESSRCPYLLRTWTGSLKFCY